ncbi:LysR family transcriptional regulator [Marinimicrobium alkaliphilum]|uniref:LysR family transcriptional regulator n=1 Tax=Marinimicrobium alkaliphilum TaxID=2202654 RepID=UPI000DB99CC1|nr:LysR family transcriptional regulator [Marinimicrobium alkaliphilum]
MDIELFKTFIEVTRTRHFGRAADHLFLTPAAVSARIRQLEQSLGVRLLHRIRGNIQMTEEGERLLPHAQQLVTAWQEARQAVALGQQQPSAIALGAAPAIWRLALSGPLAALSADQPTLRLRAEAHQSQELIERLNAQQLDIVILDELPRSAELTGTKLCPWPLQLATGEPSLGREQALARGYLAVDWGAAFDQFQARKLGEQDARLFTNNLDVALTLVREQRLCAYLPAALIEAEAAVYPVLDAPVFQRTLYACYGRAGKDLSVKQGLAALLAKALT